MFRKIASLLLITFLFSGATACSDDFEDYLPRYPFTDNGNHWSVNKSSITVYSQLENPEYDIESLVNSMNQVGANFYLELTNDRNADIVIFEGGSTDDEWLGIAHQCYFQGHILDSVIRINKENLRKYDNLPNIKQHVLCHELGHALGLGHNELDPNSCMGNCNELSDTQEEYEECMSNINSTTISNSDKSRLIELYNEHSIDIGIPPISTSACNDL